jgi:hypothetical protein
MSDSKLSASELKLKYPRLPDGTCSYCKARYGFHEKGCLANVKRE